MGSEDDEDEKNDPEGKALWVFAVRDVKPLCGREAAPQKESGKKKGRSAGKRAGSAAAPLVSLSNTPLALRGHELDGRLEDRLRRGQIPIDARIDLHGMRQEEAKESLSRFVLENYCLKNRLLLVITGKGKDSGQAPQDWQEATGPGVLKQRVPLWLEEPPLSSVILQYCAARPSHGGAGALYVLLRRQREG